MNLSKMVFLAKSVPLLLILFFCSSAVSAQVDTSSIKRVESSGAVTYEKGWGVQLFVDNNFNCTAEQGVNKFYIVTDDERFNNSERHVASAIQKALLVFSYENGPTRCIFRSHTPGYSLNFHAVVIFDDEVILDMPFVKKEGLMFENKAEYDGYLRRIEDLYRPASIVLPAEELDELTNSNIAEYYIHSDIFPGYHQTNTLSNLSIIACGTQELGVNGALIQDFGATIKRIVKMESISELVNGVFSGDCGIIPSSQSVRDQVKLQISKNRSISSSELALIERDKLSFQLKQSAANGSDYDVVRWPRLVKLEGNASELLASKANFEKKYKSCSSRLTDFGKRSVDCNCVARKNLAKTNYDQCETGYAFNYGKHKFFNYAKSFIVPPRGTSEEDSVKNILTMANCVAEKFEVLVTESITGTDNGGQVKTWTETLLFRLQPQCR